MSAVSASRTMSGKIHRRRVLRGLLWCWLTSFRVIGITASESSEAGDRAASKYQWIPSTTLPEYIQSLDWTAREGILSGIRRPQLCRLDCLSAIRLPGSHGLSEGTNEKLTCLTFSV